MSVEWMDREDAEKALVEREREAAKKSHVAPPCPACGGPGEFEFFDVSSIGGHVQVLPGRVRCTYRCWTQDPGRYLAATGGAA